MFQGALSLLHGQESVKMPIDKLQVEWQTSPGLTDYAEAVANQEARAAAIAEGRASERIWLLEHPPLYTAGTSAKQHHLVDPKRFPVHQSSRGGQYTYHGPGQRVAYVQLDLSKRDKDIRKFVCALESWIIATLADFGVRGERRTGRVGVWVVRADGSEAKIAALGVRVRKWVTMHGVSINLCPDLTHFSGIVPCGLPDFAVTSLADLGLTVDMAEVDQRLKKLAPHWLDIMP
jgi:lipoyl(octanoyl) transferase